jgi:hypothetical protein
MVSGTKITEKVVWHVVKEYSLLSQFRQRIGADSISVGARFGSDDGDIWAASNGFAKPLTIKSE